MHPVCHQTNALVEYEELLGIDQDGAVNKASNFNRKTANY